MDRLLTVTWQDPFVALDEGRKRRSRRNSTCRCPSALVRAVTLQSGLVRASARIVHAGSRTATAEARLEDAAGKLYAHGTSTCLILG